MHWMLQPINILCLKLELGLGSLLLSLPSKILPLLPTLLPPQLQSKPIHLQAILWAEILQYCSKQNAPCLVGLVVTH